MNKTMETNLEIISPVMQSRTIALKTQKGYHVIQVEKIAFCEADGSYSTIYLDDGSKFVVSKSLIDIERNLMSTDFIRCHYSYLVNARKVEKFNKGMKLLTVLGHNKNIPVSRRKCCKTIIKLKNIYDQL
jgi:two-component system LytT family response regulator